MEVSFVWSVGNESMVLVYSDGRVVDDGTVITEKYKKIERINARIAVGYTGKLVFANLVIKKTEENIDDLETIESIEEYARELEKQFKELQELYKDCNCSFIIGGVSRAHKYGIITFGTRQLSPVFVYPNGIDKIVFASISNENNKIGERILQEKLTQMIREKNDTPTDSDYYKMMRPLLKEVAKIDDTVNTQMYREIIKLDK